MAASLASSAAPARPPVLVLTGPTGMGKSALALALAEQLAASQSVQIVSVD
jgi:tRNA A37 N6-isopentenylltransferase MiaA